MELKRPIIKTELKNRALPLFFIHIDKKPTSKMSKVLQNSLCFWWWLAIFRNQTYNLTAITKWQGKWLMNLAPQCWHPPPVAKSPVHFPETVFPTFTPTGSPSPHSILFLPECSGIRAKLFNTGYSKLQEICQGNMALWSVLSLPREMKT